MAQEDQFQGKQYKNLGEEDLEKEESAIRVGQSYVPEFLYNLSHNRIIFAARHAAPPFQSTYSALNMTSCTLLVRFAR